MAEASDLEELQVVPVSVEVGVVEVGVVEVAASQTEHAIQSGEVRNIQQHHLTRHL